MSRYGKIFTSVGTKTWQLYKSTKKAGTDRERKQEAHLERLWAWRNGATVWAWKLMKSYAEFQGSDDVSGSRDASRWAYENGLIKKGDVWMNMIRSRNETSHTYDGEVADEAINRIVNEYYPSMLEFQQKMAYISTSTPKDLFNQD